MPHFTHILSIAATRAFPAVLGPVVVGTGVPRAANRARSAFIDKVVSGIAMGVTYRTRATIPLVPTQHARDVHRASSPTLLANVRVLAEARFGADSQQPLVQLIFRRLIESGVASSVNCSEN